jgi:PST family polysaccharide transporter
MNQSWTRVLPEFVRTKLDGRVNVQKIIVNIGWLSIDRVVRLGVGVFISVWVARYLGPEQFGLWSYAIAFVSLFSTLATLGLDSIVVRDLVRDPSCKEETLGTAFVLKLIGGIATLLLSVSTIFFIHSNTETYWLVGILAFGTIFLAFDTVDFWFQSQVKSKYTVYAKNAAFIIASIIRIALIVLHMPLISFVLVGLLEITLGALGMMIAYRYNHEKLWSWRFSYIRAKELMQSSWLLILSGLVIMIYMRIDQIMLGQILGEKSVGIYSAAVKLSEAWYFLPVAIVSSVFPSIVESKNKDEILYKQRMQRLLSTMIILACLIAIPITFLSKFIITFLYGESFIEASSSLIILAWTSLFVFLGIARESWMVTEGLMKFSFATTALGALSNIILNFILIPTHGPEGAAFATLISQFIAVSFSTLLFPETRVMFRMQVNSLLPYKYKEVK